LERVLALCLSAALWAALPPLPRAAGAHLTPRMASARVARTPPASGLCHTLHQQGCSLGLSNFGW
jgi:hypothetical protein